MKSKAHFWTLEVLMVVTIIFICTKISFLFQPIGIFISTLFFPILIALFLYFMFNPVLLFLENKKVPRSLAILLLYVFIIALIAVSVGVVVPTLSHQLMDLVKNMPTYIKVGREYITDLSNHRLFQWLTTQDYVSLEVLEKNALNYLKDIPNTLTASATVLVSIITNIALVIFTVPFILFYMFKDGHKFPGAAVRFLPESYHEEGRRVLKEMNETLAAYIQGQALVCLFVGAFTFVGYLIIGMPYAFILGVVAALTNIIPNLGPFIGAAPAVIVGLFVSPVQALWVIVVVTIVQQFESNILSPRIMSEKLNIHPLTIIVLILGVGNFAGIIGMILAVPAYAVTKTIVLNLVRLFKVKKNKK
ncbi:AI-2E family transporter [Bacillus sp. S14(2024)]|uniref:AI-2E family transporter n=1 Tax=Bacillus sp. S14(2024) TaxID=3162884 RepID=UPI003D223082